MQNYAITYELKPTCVKITIEGFSGPSPETIVEEHTWIDIAAGVANQYHIPVTASSTFSVFRDGIIFCADMKMDLASS
jgi:hypothetical protein